jgi:hypothetical protein
MGKYKFKQRRFPKDFQKVCDYILKEKGVKVSLSNSTLFTGHFNRQIFIHHNFDLNKNGLYSLLHEVGHVFQPATYTGANKYKLVDWDEKPKEFLMGQFLNEVDAWDRGYQIGKNLGVCIDEKLWEKTKTEALLTYFTTEL